MRDFAFYNVGCEPRKGLGRFLVLARRLLRRVLRPFFQQQEALYRDLQSQLDALSERCGALETAAAEQDRRLAASEALGWDHVAVVRRLAALEDQLAFAEPSVNGVAEPRSHERSSLSSETKRSA